ncbi:DUF1819 family protein [Pseudarthrobacter sp. AB1]|uniref:DUF1819 family protein n=1 Tax=Pseudarthrobacter sp. AB1 TaxID=2138309 RepID=UPI00186B6D88|nr:DUF1819 family protein [Pseudarthrobacter sp. AB1]MBE4717288.1 DUF1819 domain-containing protein [Pseudarthrobacter sp. AB1]
MNGEATPARPFALSFTTGALLTREASLLAPLYLEQRTWKQTRDRAVEDNLLQARTYRTSVRLVRETVKRLSAFTDAEMVLLTDATASERGHLMWAAACRRYELIGEFAEEVVRERFLVLASTLDYDDFDSFVRTKAFWHGELTQVKDSTLQKLRSNLFKMLVEAGLLTDDGHIAPVILSDRVAELLAARTPSDIRFFPTGGVA